MRSINPKETSQSLIKFIRQTFKSSNFPFAVIALSGGIDSSVSCALTAQALGRENVFPILLPYGKLNLQGVNDALEMIDSLGIPRKNVAQIDIQKTVDTIISIDKKMDFIRKGNITARVRMAFIFDQAKKRRALVVGTENKTEHLLGYYTRFGDEASDIEPLRNLYKTHIYNLARFLGLPKSVLTKKPSAGLWENQTDEDEFGFTYKDADEILYNYFDRKLSIDQICNMGLRKKVVVKVIQFANKNSFKHDLPFIPRGSG